MESEGASEDQQRRSSRRFGSRFERIKDDVNKSRNVK